MSTVHARFYLYEVTRTSYYAKNENVEAVKIKMGPVQGEPFGPATPQGQFEALIINPEAAQVFLNAPINQKFDLLISPVPSE